MIGDVIDHYRVLALLGRGNMGVVYKALDLNLDRQVAIKVMSAEARNDPDFVERFRQEARMQGALNHPNVALLFDYFVHDGAPVAVMEFIDGESFEQLIRRRGPIPAHESIPIFKQALRGVSAAHRAGIIHRDLKAANLMVTRDRIVKVMDFGIAKRQNSTDATKASTSIGSPLYMAPEQILGRAVDCRTDVYALGITLYKLLSGQPPFNPRGKTEYSVLNAHVNDPPQPPTVHFRDIPQTIVDVVMRALAKEPEARFQSVDDFMSALPEVTPPGPAAPRVAAIGTEAIEWVGPTGTVAIPRVGPTGTVAIDYALPVSESPVATGKHSGTMVLEPAASTRRDTTSSRALDNSARTVWLESQQRQSVSAPAAAASMAVATTAAPAAAPFVASLADNSTPLSAAASPAAMPSRRSAGLLQRLRAHHPAVVAVLVAALGIGALVRHAQRLEATLQDASLVSASAGLPPAQTSATTQDSISTEPAGPPPAVPSSESDAPATPTTGATTTATMVATAPPHPATTARARPDLAGTWRGSYVDASGKQLLRVVSLSISRVHADGGIEGTLQYETASGHGECKLHPRGSTYSTVEQRLQLSPEGCSARYPKELGVPLDFDGVNPQASTLKDGRIETPTGAVIRVKLKRVGEMSGGI